MASFACHLALLHFLFYRLPFPLPNLHQRSDTDKHCNLFIITTSNFIELLYSCHVGTCKRLPFFFILFLWGYGMSPNIKKTHTINRWNFPEPIHTGHFSPGSPFAIFFWSIQKHPSPGHATNGKLAWFGIEMWDLTHKGEKWGTTISAVSFKSLWKWTE